MGIIMYAATGGQLVIGVSFIISLIRFFEAGSLLPSQVLSSSLNLFLQSLCRFQKREAQRSSEFAPQTSCTCVRPK